MSIDQHPTGRDDLVFRQLDEEWVLYDPVTEKLHVLNRTAAITWLYCTGEHTPSEIAAEVKGQFAATSDATTIGEDVAAVLKQFRELGLLL